MQANFEYYKVFYYCARYHNITVAANKLCLTQPSVTRTIQNLEAALGCQLFLRSKRGVSLTPKGQLLYDKICPACELIFSAEQDLDASKSQLEGHIRMGASEITWRVWLLPRLLRFRSMYPNIKIND